MNKKTSADYQREYRKRLRQQGLTKKEVWILPENAKRLLDFEKLLRQKLTPTTTTGVHIMADKSWTTDSLKVALDQSAMVATGLATVEVIEGADPALHIVMKDYGDLPIFVTVSGDQIIAEALLWPASQVTDLAAFNEAVLRTHKYFPLSTISLDNVGGDDSYYMFGALSAASAMANVELEIEVLASNVIEATDAYQKFLIQPENI